LIAVKRGHRTSPVAFRTAVLRAQFDLANVTASGIDLFRNQSRARGEPAHIE
jgi:hypothetical protein